MVGKRRLNQATLGVLKSTRIAQAVPEGAVIEIRDEPGESDRMIDVFWEGQAFMMFVRDLLDRGQEIDEDRPGTDLFLRISVSTAG
jgi:hypothetical protein